MVTPAVSSPLLLRGVDQPDRERECWLFNKLRLTPVVFMAESRIQHGGGVIGPIQPSLKQDKEDNLTL